MRNIADMYNELFNNTQDSKRVMALFLEKNLGKTFFASLLVTVAAIAHDVLRTSKDSNDYFFSQFDENVCFTESSVFDRKIELLLYSLLYVPVLNLSLTILLTPSVFSVFVLLHLTITAIKKSSDATITMINNGVTLFKAIPILPEQQGSEFSLKF